MAGFIKGHTITALVVLVAAAAWVGTGEFTSVGSNLVHAAQRQPEPVSEGAPAAPLAAPQPAAPAEAAAPLRRVVEAVMPEFSNHARLIRLSGVTAPDKRAVLAARASGAIETLTVSPGEVIAADFVVLTLEGPEARAAVNIAEIALDQRLRELDVAEKLFTAGNRTELQLIAARSAASTAEAQLEQARAAVDRLQLRAPFAGVVDSVEVERGEWITAGTKVAALLSLDPIAVKAEVSELFVRYVRPGAEAELTLANGVELSGTVRFVSKEASPQTRTFPVEIALPNPGGAIGAGMTAEVRLFADPVRSVTVPRSVITLSDAGELGLRVVGADNIAHFASVELLDDTPGGLVLGGIPEGVRIIIAGQDLVRDGDLVIVASDIGTPAAGAKVSE
ncbi:MAG: efflux RND transporter periplasmic adaptor subunit [Rhodobacteraceae bacterium]|nr:efflux RND transporter periplasmic adaptor subunit [Paracoccaceae bacterium]